MIVDGLRCWRCGESVADEPQPLARAAECRHCMADLHVCKLCEFFDSGARKGCKEPVADEVDDKERSNFCGYFQPVVLTSSAAGSVGADATDSLESLFGMPPGSAPRTATTADAARAELDKLFGEDEPKR